MFSSWFDYWLVTQENFASLWVVVHRSCFKSCANNIPELTCPCTLGAFLVSNIHDVWCWPCSCVGNQLKPLAVHAELLSLCGCLLWESYVIMIQHMPSEMHRCQDVMSTIIWFNEWLVIAYWESVTLMLSSLQVLDGSDEGAILGVVWHGSACRSRFDWVIFGPRPCMMGAVFDFELLAIVTWTYAILGSDSSWVTSYQAYHASSQYRCWCWLQSVRMSFLWEVIAVSWVASLNLSIMATWTGWLMTLKMYVFGFVTEWLERR